MKSIKDIALLTSSPLRSLCTYIHLLFAPLAHPSRTATLLIILIFLTAWNTTAWAYWTTDKDGKTIADNQSVEGFVSNSGSTYYVIDESKEQSVFQTGSYSYYQKGPGAQITFDANSQTTAVKNLCATDGFSVFYNDYAGTYKFPSMRYASYGPYNINVDSKSIKFYGAKGATLNRYFKNVKVTMASYCVPEVTSIAFGSNTYLSSDSTTLKIYWSNMGNQTISKSGDTDRFTVSPTTIPSKAGYYGNTVITITYKRDAVGNHTMKLTVNGQTITVTGTTNKGDPTIDCSKVSASRITYGQKLSASTITGGNATYKNNSTYTGTYSWQRSDASTHTALGCTDYVVIFTPTNTNLNSVNCTIQVPITKVAQAITWTPANTYFVDTDVQLNGTTSGHDASVYYTSSDNSIATIDGTWIRMHKAGDVIITAHADTTCNYNAATTVSHTFQFRNRPVIHWNKIGTNDHIYSGDSLVDLAYATFGNNTFNLPFTYTTSPSNILIQAEEQNLLIANKQLTQEASCTVTATFAGNEQYCAVSASQLYKIEPKATPVFKLNGEELPESPVRELHLKIGETANMAFESTSESQFFYPTNTQYVSYVHNAETHTGVISAKRFGDEVIRFAQGGTTKIFEASRQVHIYVEKHPVTLSSWLDGITCEVGDEVSESDAYAISATPTGTQPTQNAVTITSSNENIVAFEDGMWRAMNEGTATLTFAMPTNNYWTGDTITATITVKKKTPTITWNLDTSYPWGSQMGDPVTSSNTELPFTVVSSNPSVANYVNGRIEVYNIVGSATFTLTQAGNGKWNAANANLTKTISVFQPQNHVPFTINSTNKNDIVTFISSKDNVIWDNDGYKLGNGTGIAWDYPDENFIVTLTGIPSTLTFSKTNDKIMLSLPAKGQCGFYIYESADRINWKEIWTRNEREESFGPITEQLSPSTKYIKFRYNGTIYGHFNNITVTERKEIVPEVTTKDYGSGYIGNSPTSRDIRVDWYNVKTCTVSLTGTNADCFAIGEGSETIASSLDNYGSKPLTIKYLHEVAGNHTATLRIESEDGKTATVALSGKTDKAIQEIIWREDITPLPKNELYTGAAMATSGLPVTLTAEDPSILQVTNGDEVTGIGVGTTRLFAYQAGNTKWEAVSETIYVEVTNKLVQHIIWTDRLSNVKRENGQTKQITLTAYSDADSSLPITYTLDAAAGAFASISGNKLTITGWGTGYITARQAGNDNYVAVSKTLKLVSRDPDAGCEPLVLDEPDSRTLHTIDSEVFDLNGEPRTIAFDAKVNQHSALYGIWVGEYYNGSWHEVEQVSRFDMSTNYQHYGPYNLHRNSTRVKIYTETGTTWQRDFKNVEVTLAKYLELDHNDMDFSAVQYGQIENQQFTINYSNITGTLDVELQNESSQFEILTSTVGEDCGDVAQAAVIRVRCKGQNIGTENNVIIIKNKDQRLEIPVSATVVKASQVITWNDANPTDILTTDNIVLTATATSSLPVTFVSGDNTIAEPYDKGDGTYGLTIHTSGSITITARQAGNDRYSAAPEVAHTYTISKATPTITSLPVAATMTLPNTSLSDCALTGGAASTAGSFAWEDGSLNATLSNQGYTVLFIPDNTAWYNTVRLTVVVPVQKAPQTITWTFSNLDMYCNAVHTFAATASSGLPVRYETSDASIAYVDDGNHLRINKGGEVTITARQDGDDIYTAAPSVPKTLTIRRMAPAIVTVPTVSPMKIGRLLSDASLSDGRAELNSLLVEGVFAWVDGNSTTMNEAGTFEKQIAFNPSNSNYYEPVYTTLTVVVEKYAPDITHNLRGSDITYGQPLSESVISGTITATDNVKIPSENVEGSYTWVNPAQIVNAGMNTTATVRFTPDNTDWYNAVELDVPLNIAQAEPVLNITASHIRFGQPLSRAVLSNIGGTIGSCSWPTELDADHNFLELGTHNLPVTFTSADPNYLNATGSVSVEVLEGYTFVGSNGTDGDNWNSSDNWQNGDTPGDDDKVFVNADVVVTNHVSVGSLTIIEGANITIQDGGVLEIGDDDSFERAAYGDITVHNGGELILGNGELDVRNLIIEAAIGNESDGTNPAHPGRSGQVTNPDKLAINGDVYFELVLDQSGSCTPGWYDFTVPFPVDAAHGVSRWQNGAWNNNLQIETHYAIMAHYEDIQAQGNYGWKKYHGILQPGECYTMTINNPAPRYRFRKVTGAALGTPDDYRIAATGTGDQSGWNGIGNGTLTHANLQIDNVSIVQIYDHATNSYTSQPIDGYTYVVGSAVFVQVAQPTSVVYNTPDPEATLRDLRAPQRQRLSDTPDYAAVSLTAASGSATGDHLYLAAAQDADNTYSIGHDLLKMGTPASAKIPQIWSTAYGKQLCAVELPEQAGGTTFDISLYAPAEGYYLLQAEQLPDHTELWLTEYGVPVWNLSLAPYNLTLPKGTTTGFALTLMPRTVIQPVTTGTDRLSDEPDPTRKILLNDHVYILRNGMMFDAAGKRIR